MSTSDYNLANQSRTAFRSELNTILASVLSRNSSATAPTTTAPYMHWPDTTSGVLKRRNAADSGWIVESTIDETFLLARSSNTMLDVSDIGKSIAATSTFTQTLDAAATLGDGWWVRYRNDGTGVITIDPNSTEQINGANTLEIYPGEAVQIVCNGTAFKAYGTVSPSSYKVGSFTRDISTASGNQSVTGVGFKPKAILFGMNVSGQVYMSQGWSDGSTNAMIFSNQGGTAGAFGFSTSACLGLQVTGANAYSGAVSSFDSDGFTIAWTKTGSPTGTATIIYKALR